MTESFAENFFKCCRRTQILGALGAIGVGYIGGSGIMNLYIKPDIIPIVVETETSPSPDIDLSLPLSPRINLSLWNAIKFPLGFLYNNYVIIATAANTIFLTRFAWTVLRRFKAFIRSVRNGAVNRNNVDDVFQRFENDVRDIRDAQINQNDIQRRNQDSVNEFDEEVKRNLRETNEIIRQQGEEFSKRFKEIKQQLDLFFKGDRERDEREKVNENLDRLNKQFYLFREGGEAFYIPIRGGQKIGLPGTSIELQQQLERERDDNRPKPINKSEVELQQMSKKLWETILRGPRQTVTQHQEADVLNRILNNIISVDIYARLKEQRQQLQRRVTDDVDLRRTVMRDILDLIDFHAKHNYTIGVRSDLPNLSLTELEEFRKQLYRSVLMFVYQDQIRQGNINIIQELHRMEGTYLNEKIFYDILEEVDFSNIENAEELKNDEILFVILKQISNMELNLRNRYDEFRYVPELRQSFARIQIMLQSIFIYIPATQSWHLTRVDTIYEAFLEINVLLSKVIRREGFEIPILSGFTITKTKGYDKL